MAVFDERLTGEPYTNEELALIFHMLEEVGLAIRNSWLHDQLAANHAMIADILGTSAAAAWSSAANLATLHANTRRDALFPAASGRDKRSSNLPTCRSSSAAWFSP